MPHARAALAVALAFGLTACQPNGSPDASGHAAPVADLVIYGHVWTGDSLKPWADAIAVSGDTIIAVGDSGTVGAFAGAATRIINNGRAMVAPGFNDGHTHFASGGFQLAGVDLRDAATPEEFTARLKAYAATLRPGEWIVGGDWDHERWAGTPLPEHGWIDSVTPKSPVFVNRLDGHMAVANALAMRLAHVSRATRDVPGGTIVRDADGNPTGVFKDNAQDLIWSAVPDQSAAQYDSSIVRATAWAASKGVTGVSAVSVGASELAAIKRAYQAGRLKTRISVYVPLGAWHRAADSLKANGPGDDFLRVAGVKGFVDGSLGSRTALFYEPYSDDPSTSGLLVTPEDSLRRWIGAADSAGLQIAVHAIGERANGLVLDIYDSVARAHGARDRRFRIEHAQHLRPADVQRLARMGVVASMQPYHAIDDGRWAEKRIGAERIRNTYVFRSLLDSHAHLGFGSDWTVAPMDPLLGIYAAVTRRTLDDKNPGGWVPEEKISVDEALRAYTSGDAYAVFADGKRGTLQPGRKADIVVLDQDLTTIRPEEIRNAKVRMTLLGGKVVYSAQ
jgi:predicted amidohydrolase YtcJ